ncbi:hypothetical protein [Variovorax boronicumulans]|uniref:hypothetical protein n=1 Tax=Variovorax boronicumulans TaxID=436515 RepID=UPI00339A3E72
MAARKAQAHRRASANLQSHLKEEIAMSKKPVAAVPFGAIGYPAQQSATAAPATIREKVAELKLPESSKEARARTVREMNAYRDETLRPTLHFHEPDNRPLAKLPVELGATEVYADTPEYALWVQLIVVRDWMRAFGADLQGLRMTAPQAVERLDKFLADTAIPGHLRSTAGDRLRYLRAGLVGEPGVDLGTHMTALRLTVAESERVVRAVNLPAPPGPLSVAPTEGTGRLYGWSRSESH